MQQIKKREIRKKKGRWMVGSLSVINEDGRQISDGDVCFGYEKMVGEELSMGVHLTVGDIISVGKHTVSIMTNYGIQHIDKRKAKILSRKRRFVIKEIQREEIGRYELCYYLENLTKRHDRFSYSFSIEDLDKRLKDFLLNKIAPLDNSLFFSSSPATLPYEEEDINIENLEYGKRYKKLVFMRFIGCLITRLYFPDHGINGITSRWGYTNHSTFYHAKKTITTYLFYEKRLSEIILEIINDTVRHLQPEVSEQVA